MRVLVTGCARSGTHYTSAALRHYGLDVGHERDGAHGRVCWYATGMLHAGIDTFSCLHPLGGYYDVIVHQTRSPLPCIGSLLTIRPFSWRFVHSVIDLNPDLDPADLAAEYWLAWNKIASQLAQVHVRIEDIQESWHEVAPKIGLRSSRWTFDGPTDLHSRPHPQLDWSDFSDDLAYRLKSAARGYGYDL